MKKSCWICNHSKEITYTTTYRYATTKKPEKASVLFCIAVPPALYGDSNLGHDFGYIKSGGKRLELYKRYPIVQKVAPCSLYLKTTNKNKIKSYKYLLEREREEKEKKEKEKKESIAIAKKDIAARKKQKEIEKIARGKIREELAKRKKRREYQKQYRAKKREEKRNSKVMVGAEVPTEDHGRFGILDFEATKEQ